MNTLPVLYSFRRCPYAIRARMALAYACITTELREVHLRHKPEAMLNASAKGTVPVLVLPEGKVIDESLAVMRWALEQNDPDGWLQEADNPEHQELLEFNDGFFKENLDRYKYADRHPEKPKSWYRDQALPFLERLDQMLETNSWLMGPTLQMADVAVFPFIRQFAMVDREWFDAAPLPHLQRWLDSLLTHQLFSSVMKKTRVWQEGQPIVLFEPDPPETESQGIWPAR